MRLKKTAGKKTKFGIQKFFKNLWKMGVEQMWILFRRIDLILKKFFRVIFIKSKLLLEKIINFSKKAIGFFRYLFGKKFFLTGLLSCLITIIFGFLIIKGDLGKNLRMILNKKGKLSAVGFFSIFNYSQRHSQREKLEFFKGAESVFIDPLELVDWIKEKKDFLLLDTRDEISYKKGHILFAQHFEEKYLLEIKEIKRKEVVLYGSFSFEDGVLEKARLLTEKGVNCRVLTIGFNEFRHLKAFWLPISLWDDFEPEDFIETEEGAGF